MLRIDGSWSVHGCRKSLVSAVEDELIRKLASKRYRINDTRPSSSVNPVSVEFLRMAPTVIQVPLRGGILKLPCVKSNTHSRIYLFNRRHDGIAESIQTRAADYGSAMESRAMFDSRNPGGLSGEGSSRVHDHPDDRLPAGIQESDPPR